MPDGMTIPRIPGLDFARGLARQFRVMPNRDFVDVPLESLPYDRCGNSR